MNKSLFVGLVISLGVLTASMISVQTVNAMLLSASPSFNPNPRDSQNHWSEGGQCLSPAQMGEVVLSPEQCANIGPDCPNGQQTLVIPQDEDDGPIFNSDPCLTIVQTGDDDEEDEEDEEDVDEGVQNKLDNINESTNDEDAPINQPDNVGNNNNLQPQPLAQQPGQQQQGLDPTGQSLVDACLQTPGMTPQKCSNYLGSSDVGNYCTTLTIAGVPCPDIQDPSKTYGDPEGALAESNKKIEQTQNAIEGFNRLYPPGSLGGEFAGPGSTTNRPGQ
jgi:hypothetical protein